MPAKPNPFKKLEPLKESARKKPDAKKGKLVKKTDSIEVTLRIRRKNAVDDALDELQQTGKTYTRQEYQQAFGLSDADVQTVESFAASAGLSVVHTSYGRRIMILKGNAENITRAFGVTLHYYSKNKQTFHAREGLIKIPVALKGIVEGVFGLDTRPQATPKLRMRKKKTGSRAKAQYVSYNPNQLATIYNFPEADGTGETIGILEFGGGHTLAR